MSNYKIKIEFNFYWQFGLLVTKYNSNSWIIDLPAVNISITY